MICPEKSRGKSKVLSLLGISVAAGLELLENRPLTDSPEKNSLGDLCASKESCLRRDEWAVKKGTEVVSYFLLPVITIILSY